MTSTTMITTKRNHGHDGRYPRKPPPWKYKLTAIRTKCNTTNDRNDLCLFLGKKQPRTTNKITTHTTRASSPPNHHHPVLHRSSSASVNLNATDPFDGISTIPPTDRLNNYASSSCSTPPHTSQRHGPHPRHQLPDQHTSARHPSDFKQYSLQHASHSRVTETHPSEQHTSDRQLPDNTTTTITHPTDSTSRILKKRHAPTTCATQSLSRRPTTFPTPPTSSHAQPDPLQNHHPPTLLVKHHIFSEQR